MRLEALDRLGDDGLDEVVVVCIEEADECTVHRRLDRQLLWRKKTSM